MFQKLSKITSQLRSRISKTGTPDSIAHKKREFWIAMVLLVGVSSLPFLNELITQEDGSLQTWILSQDVQESLKSENGKILGYSKYSVMLYYLLTYTYILIGSLGWFIIARGKSYRYAILICTLSAGYHIFLILSENRATFLNNAELKLWGTAGSTLFFFMVHHISFYRRNVRLKPFREAIGIIPERTFSAKVILPWLGLVILSVFPYIHDIVSPRGQGMLPWVPFDGFEGFVRLGDRDYWGFLSYRALVLTLFVQLLAQVVWAGWWIDSKYNLYKPFLLVPVGLSLYQLVLIVMMKNDSYLNKPDFKFIGLLILGVLIGLIYYFKNESLPEPHKTIKDVVPQNGTYNNRMK